MDLKMAGGGIQPKANITQSMKNRMNFLIARQGIIASNVANASTPNYIARDLAFKGALTKVGVSLDTTHQYHIQGGKNTTTELGKITYDDTHIRADGNSVKLDQEMLKLSDIQMNYRLITKLYSKHSGMHKMVLQGAGR